MQIKQLPHKPRGRCAPYFQFGSLMDCPHGNMVCVRSTWFVSCCFASYAQISCVERAVAGRWNKPYDKHSTFFFIFFFSVYPLSYETNNCWMRHEAFSLAELLMPLETHTSLANLRSLYHTRLIGPCAPWMGQTGTLTSPPSFSHTPLRSHTRPLSCSQDWKRSPLTLI